MKTFLIVLWCAHVTLSFGVIASALDRIESKCVIEAKGEAKGEAK